MSNWFENNPTRSIIGHTFLTAAATWAVFAFVFDENKVTLHEAKVGKIEAESKEVTARNQVLVTRLEFVTDENRQLRTWMEGSPKSIPFYEKEISRLQSELTALKSASLTPTDTKLTGSIENRYLYSSRQDGSTAFVDKQTNVVFGVEKINTDNSANVNLTLPSGERIKKKDVTPGETWTFMKGDSNYMLILDSVDWATNKYKSSVVELPEK